MKYWVKLSPEEQSKRIKQALEQTINYTEKPMLGIPASVVDKKVFYGQTASMKNFPFLQAILQNPNHIGCHTLGESEPFFAGTQDIEREVIQILAQDIFGAEEDAYDGYIASGGTEANIQAVWMYRNYYFNEYDANIDEILLLASEDTHYSVAKASNLLQIKWRSVSVNMDDRTLDLKDLESIIKEEKKNGKKYVIVISNVGTTMFGSIDNPDDYATMLNKHKMKFKIHLDAAFGGFIYPMVVGDHNIGFKNPIVSSITLDAHKMLQAPYGTGIFLTRKGLIANVYTKEAQYVNGMDITLCGSRSGANAIAVWMLLKTYGPYGWLEKLNTLLYRTDRCCYHLRECGIRFYRHPKMNIISIRAEDIPHELADEYGLVPDTHEGETKWYKIVVMQHVEIEILKAFTDKLELVHKNK
ncbi:MAG TPA: aminotransferase class I/II-fold pyridoxal phosphate-dependent enzyme [Edaphocola sp.]|nr:aminotransferase class I/II-fold pyridoxal phosphate-dependent enzyme [Edaphocola sp.]